MKFTTGPWTKGWGRGVTGPTTPRAAGPCCGGEYYPYTIVSKNLETIAIIPQQEDGIMDANACLIAAAPEMYETLKWFMERSGLNNGAGGLLTNGSEGKKIYEKFNKALAKAKGEE